MKFKELTAKYENMYPEVCSWLKNHGAIFDEDKAYDRTVVAILNSGLCKAEIEINEEGVRVFATFDTDICSAIIDEEFERGLYFNEIIEFLESLLKVSISKKAIVIKVGTLDNLPECADCNISVEDIADELINTRVAWEYGLECEIVDEKQ